MVTFMVMVMHRRGWLGGRKGIQPEKLELLGAGVVISL